jgi:hypothetical protein
VASFRRAVDVQRREKGIGQQVEDTQRYGFEEIPEEQRYWFLVSGVRTPSEEAGQENAWLPPEMEASLRDIETDVQADRVFGTTGDKIREIRKKNEETRKRMNEVGYGYNALSIPWWPEAYKWEHKQELEYVQAPMLFSTREAAEKEKRAVEGAEADGYSRLTDQYGEEHVNEAYDNPAPLRAMWLDWGWLLDKLEDSDFLCVMVNHKLKLRQDFAEELRKKLEELEVEELEREEEEE